MRRRLLLTLWASAVVLAFALVAASCGGSDETVAPSDTATEPAETASAQTTPAETAAPAETSGETAQEWPDLSGETITFYSYGGQAEDAIKETWTGPWSQLTGAEVLYDSPTDFAKIKAQVDSGNVTWDVGFADGYFVIANCGTLFTKLTDAVDVSNIDPAYLTTECGLPTFVYALLNVYDTTQFGDNPPTTWADFFDIEKYPGKRGMWSWPLFNGAIEAALLADGVAPDELYPLDVDRAFAKLDTIRDDIVFFDSLAQGTEQLVSGEVAMSLIFNGRAYFGITEGAHYAPVWNQALLAWDQLAIIEGSQHVPASESLLNYIATPGPQDEFAKLTAFGPTTKGSPPGADELLTSWLATTPANREQAIETDYSWWAENYNDVAARWQDWISG